MTFARKKRLTREEKMKKLRYRWDNPESRFKRRTELGKDLQKGRRIDIDFPEIHLKTVEPMIGFSDSRRIGQGLVATKEEKGKKGREQTP